MSVLTACAGTLPPPGDEHTLRRIYDDHATAGHSASASLQRPLVPASTLDLSDYTRSVHNETDTLFPKLPNPTLFLYVSPHLAGGEGFPVPGYTIPVTLFDRVHYALPGERTDEH